MSNTSDKTVQYITVTEAAGLFGVTVKTVHRWIEAGLFPGTIRLSPQRKSEYRIPLEAIEQFQKNRKVS